MRLVRYQARRILAAPREDGNASPAGACEGRGVMPHQFLADSYDFRLVALSVAREVRGGPSAARADQ